MSRRGRKRSRPGNPSSGTDTAANRPAERIGHEQPGAVLRGPPVTITCACGQKHAVPYGDVWTCDECGRTWDTGQIPRAEYEAIRRITWRFRLLPIVFGLLLATAALFFIVTDNYLSVFVLLPLSLMVWFTFLRGAHRRRFRAALADRRRWRLDGQ
jgi:hypothetical protein